MRTYDVTLTIAPELPVWPGDPPIELERISKIEVGDSANVSRINMTVHVGTHVDAPYHFLGGDTMTVDLLPLNILIGRAYVLQLPGNVDLITAEILERCEIPARTRRLLFKTRNSDLWRQPATGFQTDYVALSPDGAQYLVDRGIKLVGIDYLSIAAFNEGAATHEILMRAGIVIIEGLNLSEVGQGRYSLYCLPLKISGSDGAPARVILIGV